MNIGLNNKKYNKVSSNIKITCTKIEKEDLQRMFMNTFGGCGDENRNCNEQCQKCVFDDGNIEWIINENITSDIDITDNEKFVDHLKWYYGSDLFTKEEKDGLEERLNNKLRNVSEKYLMK